MKEKKSAKSKASRGKASRRASLKSFAKGKFQSPVHSNGFKQDVLIDIYGGDVGFKSSDIHINTAAGEAHAAGKTFFYHDGALKKTSVSRRGSVSGTAADASDISGRAINLNK